ncbi:unnamed protein product, partial [Coregonus sp. 'balchen']
DDIFIPEKVFILKETVQEEAEEVITKELEAQLDCPHDNQYTTKSCPYTPQMELTESEISEDQNSLYEPESSESQ